MKKLYFIFLLFLTGTIFGQVYHPMLDSVNDWHTITNYIPLRTGPSSIASNPPCTYPLFYSDNLEIYTTQDSVINSFTYKMVYAVGDFSPPSTACFVGFIREDTAARKVYFIDNQSNPEILLYDFSMTVGNTINLNFVQTPGYFSSGTFTLDSIRTIHIRAGNRKIFYLRNNASPWATLCWIESVGATINPFYPFCMNQSGYAQFPSCYGIPHDMSEFLTCFDHATKVYYDSCAYTYAVTSSCFQVNDTCNYHNICGDVHEIPSLMAFEISPNPSPGKCLLKMEVSSKGEFTFIAQDITGKNVMKEISLGNIPAGKTEKEIDLSVLPDGIYFAGLRSGENTVYRKIIIRR